MLRRCSAWAAARSAFAAERAEGDLRPSLLLIAYVKLPTGLAEVVMEAFGRIGRVHLDDQVGHAVNPGSAVGEELGFGAFDVTLEQVDSVDVVSREERGHGKTTDGLAIARCFGRVDLLEFP